MLSQGAAARQVLRHPRSREIRLGLVAMRVKEHTLSNEQLHHYLATLPVPVRMTPQSSVMVRA